MLVHVKTPHTEIEMKGEISKPLLKLLTKLYGDSVIVEEDSSPWRETQFFQENKHLLNPGDMMRLSRERAGMTQTQLGEILGGIPKQNIYEMEKGKRPIPKEVAKKLSQIFKRPIERFLFEENS